MTDHIIDITYYPNVHQYTARTVYQYDKGWQLKISGLTTNKIIQVQYGIEGMAQTLNVDPEYQENCYIAKIPDVLLTQIKGIVAYVYVADASLGQTVCYIRIPITPREKPADYTYTQEETAGYAQLLAQLTQATKEVEELDKELEIIVDAATMATASANAASQAASNAVAEFENIKQDVNSQISELEERLTELEENPPSALPEDWTPTIENIEGLSDALGNIVEVSSEEPQDKNTELWINPDSEELQIPQIDDVNVSAYDTYSSQKIEEKVTGLQKDIKTLANTISLLHTDAGVPDTSAKAASHELYATDSPMRVTLHGATYQSGSGDPSPDNVMPISGIGVSRVQCSGKNILSVQDLVFASRHHVATYTLGSDYVEVAGEAGSASDWGLVSYKPKYPLLPGTYTFSFNADATGYTDVNPYIVIRRYNENGNAPKLATAQLNTPASFTIEEPSILRIDFSLNDKAEALPEARTVRYHSIQLEIGSVATPYEPYNANVIDMTDALNGEALYGDGTVMDKIENDVLSGCDKWVILNGTQNGANGLTMNDNQIAYLIPAYDMVIGANAFSDRFPAIPVYGNNVAGIYINSANQISVSVPKEILLSGDYGYDGTVDTSYKAISAYLAANPLKVYYRSTKYTPENDLRVCKLTRCWRVMKLTGKERVNIQSVNDAELVNVLFEHRENGWPNSVRYPANKSSHFAFDNALIANATREGIMTSLNESFYLRIHSSRLSAETKSAVLEYLAAQHDAGTPVQVWYRLETPEAYYIDPIELRKPVGLMPVTVTGSGETEVAYAHDTKHYIDSQIAAVVALAMNG